MSKKVLIKLFTEKRIERILNLQDAMESIKDEQANQFISIRIRDLYPVIDVVCPTMIKCLAALDVLM